MLITVVAFVVAWIIVSALVIWAHRADDRSMQRPRWEGQENAPNFFGRVPR